MKSSGMASKSRLLSFAMPRPERDFVDTSTGRPGTTSWSLVFFVHAGGKALRSRSSRHNASWYNYTRIILSSDTLNYSYIPNNSSHISASDHIIATWNNLAYFTEGHIWPPSTSQLIWEDDPRHLQHHLQLHLLPIFSQGQGASTAINPVKACLVTLSNTRTRIHVHWACVPMNPPLQGSKNEMKPYAAAAYAYTVMKCGCMSVLYTRIDWRIHRMLIQQLQNSRSCLHFASQQSLTHAMSLH